MVHFIQYMTGIPLVKQQKKGLEHKQQSSRWDQDPTFLTPIYTYTTGMGTKKQLLEKGEVWLHHHNSKRLIQPLSL